MPDTLVTDFQHFLNEKGSIAPDSGPARKLAEHIAAIVAELSSELGEVEGFKKVPCRRRPGHRRCEGLIESWINPESGEICWQCPKCGDNGYIQNWEGTIWDLTDVPSRH